jgi:sulfur carrier protein
MIPIQVNGEQLQVQEGSTLADLIAARGLAPQEVAAEVNKVLVPRATRGGRVLQDADRIELVTLVGGG